MSAPAPPLPPAPPPIDKSKAPPTGPPVPNPPVVAETGPVGAFLVELLVYTGGLFKNHWAYFVRSHTNRDIGIMIHAAGDVMNGFKFEIKRCHDFQATGNHPSQRIPLQWVDAKYFDEKAMFNNGVRVVVDQPVGGFEISAAKVKVPSKSLNTTNVVATASNDTPAGKNKVTQRNCQTWIVEAADQLVTDGIFNAGVATYLRAIQQ
ncbi:hypothetical protein BGW80DRAFT_1356829 [Lactifluus volemus]|nr:hypothetical protein BGW80DRAFT_1356829 [Lactifluus volemus]